MYCTHIISLSVTMDPIFAVCLCVLFSFLFVFIHFSCEKPASRLLPSPFFCYLLRKCCQKEQTTERETDGERERERGRERENKTKTAISPLHDEAALSCCCFVSFAMAAASAKMKLIEFIIFYAFYMAPTKIKIRSRILLIYLIKKDPVCCFYYCYLYFYFFITYNKSAEFAVLHN